MSSDSEYLGCHLAKLRTCKPASRLEPRSSEIHSDVPGITANTLTEMHKHVHIQTLPGMNVSRLPPKVLYTLVMPVPAWYPSFSKTFTL